MNIIQYSFKLSKKISAGENLRFENYFDVIRGNCAVCQQFQNFQCNLEVSQLVSEQTYSGWKLKLKLHAATQPTYRAPSELFITLDTL